MIQKALLYVSIALISINFNAQQKDTIFYNADWKKTLKAEASYYRPLPLEQTDSLYLIKDYYSNGQLQMEGFSKDATKAVFSGEVKWYYPNGKLQLVRHYKNEKQNGSVKRYFEDGTLKTEGNVVNGAYKNGTFVFKAQHPTHVVNYKDGAVVERLSFYEATKTVAERQFIAQHDQVQKSTFYNKSGKVIASMTYKTKSGNYRAPIAGTSVHFSYSKTYLAKAIIATTVVRPKGEALQEITSTPDHKIIATGIRKDGYPFEGTFLKNGILSSYVNGKKEGEERCCLDRKDIQTKGYYKANSKYEGRFFSITSRTKSSYTAGLKHGEQITYDTHFNISHLKTFTNGVLNGKYIGSNPYNSSKTYTGYYKNGTPDQGSFFEFDALKTYKDAKIIKETRYDYNTHLPKKTVVYDTLGHIVSEIFYKDGNTYTLKYKDGAAYEGVKIEDYSLTTYKNGAYNGPFIIYDKHQTIKGNYKSFYYDGELHFIQKHTKDTLKCTFKAGKPIDGINGFNGKVGYKDGKKHGFSARRVNNRRYTFDSITAHYKHGLKVDTVKYFKNKTLISYGVFKAGQPFHGTFHDTSKLENFSIYKNGRLIQKEARNYYDRYRHQFLYNEGTLQEEKVFYWYAPIDSLSYVLTYKDKHPYSGVKFTKDSLANRFITTSYRSGKKQGLETHYKKPFKDVVKQFSYNKDLLEGEASYQYTYNKDSLTTGLFKKGQPYQGEFVNTYKNHLEVARYRKGKLEQKTFYTYSKYASPQDFIDKVIYKKGKAYHGLELRVKAETLSAKAYKDGQLSKTYIRPSLRPLRSYKTILHTPLKDSLAGDSKETFAIHYKTPKKASGRITYYLKGKAYGTISFQNRTLTAATLTSNPLLKKNGTFKLYFNAKGVLINSIEVNAFKAVREVPTKIIGAPYEALGNLMRLQENHPNLIYTLYLDGKAVSQVELRDGKPYQGVVFESDTLKKTYKYRKFEAGKRTENSSGLTKKALLQKLKL